MQMAFFGLFLEVLLWFLRVQRLRKSKSLLVSELRATSSELPLRSVPYNVL